jgi:eukaryotic-like serine/threonine-protein kinase
VSSRTDVQPGGAAGLDDPRVARAVEEYLAALEAGLPPDRQDFLARHPDIAEALGPCLDALQFIRAAAPGIRPPEAPPAGEGAASPLGEEDLGDYRILCEVGRGGMGIVYEAVQLSLGRRVALKVLPLAATLDPKQRQRFHNEARAAASLDHPNIVKVHAVGEERGVSYYAMQFINGHPLDEVIRVLRHGGDGAGGCPAAPSPAAAEPTTDEPREANPEGGAALPCAETVPQVRAQATTSGGICDRGYFRGVAELGIQAAEALEHAHQLGVVHRDVKPGNLLVNGQGHLWVTDFGLARTAADSGLTMTGDLLGTLRYMSPEQALAQHGLVDHRTDIYSLGLTLYELLTLRPAVEGKDRQEVLNRIVQEEPATPRKLNRGIPVDLETIVLKAISKEPTNRYTTAKALAEDLRRYLADEPIQARRPTMGQRVGKWARRHRTFVRAAGLLFLLGVAGLVVSLWFIWRAKEEADLAWGEEKKQQERTKARLKQAQTNMDLSFAALDKIVLKLAERGLLSLDPAENEDAKLFRFALGLYESIAEKNSDDPAGWRQAARVYRKVGHIYRRLEQNDQAEEALAKAVKFGDKAVALSPEDVKGRLFLVDCHNERGELFRDTGRPRQAEDAFRQALAISRQAVKEHPADRGCRSDMASALINLGFHLQSTGKAQEADPYLAESRALLKQLVADFPKDPHLRAVLGGMLHNLAHTHDKREQLEEARQLSRRAVHHLETARGLQKIHARRDEQLCLAYLGLARILSRMGKHDEAVTYCLKQLKLAGEMIRDYPRVPNFRRALMQGQEALAGQMSYIGGHGLTSEKLLNQALDLQKQMAAEYKDRSIYQFALGQNHANRGRLLQARGKYAEAEQAYRQALELLKDLPEHRTALAQTRLAQGNLFRVLGKLPEAAAAYRQAAEELRQVARQFPNAAENHKWIANALNNLGSILREMGRLPEAEAEFRQAVVALHELARRHRDGPGYRYYLARAELSLANTLIARGCGTEADAFCRKAQASFEQLVATAPSRTEYQTELAHALTLRGVILRKSRRLAEAEKAYQRAVELWQALAEKEPDLPEHRRELAATHYNRGLLLADAGRPQDAEKAYRQARAVQRQLLEEFPKLPGHHGLYAKILNNLGMRLRHRGEHHEERQLFTEAVRHGREAVKLAPGHRSFREQLCKSLANLTWTLIYQNEHALAAKTSEEMTKVLPEHWAIWSDAALHLSACVLLVEKMPHLSPEARAGLIRRYTDRMEEMWRKALGRCPDISTEQLKLAKSLGVLADSYAKSGDQERAQILQQEATALRARAALAAKKKEKP